MTVGRFARWFAAHRGAVVLAAALLSLTAAVPGAAVLLLERALAHVLSGDTTALSRVVAGFVGLYALHGAGVVARTAVSKRVAWAVASSLRRALHARWLRAAPRRALGDRLAALTDEVDQVQYGVSAAVTALRNPLALAGLVAVAVSVAPGLAGPAFALWTPALLLAWGTGRRVRRLAVRARRARAALGGELSQQLSGLTVIQAHGLQTAEEARLAVADAADRRARWALDVGRTLPSVAVQLWGAVALGGLLVVGTAQVDGGRLEPASLGAFVVALGLAARPLSGLAEVHSLLQRSLGALGRVDAALAEPPRVVSPRAPRPLPEGPLSLVWQDVVVLVDGRPILDQVCAEASPGCVTAVRGPTGAGKTTLLRLAWRQRDPSGGVVRLGGVDLTDLALDDVARAVAVVPQDLLLFGRSVLDNVTHGDPAPDRARAVAALRRAAADFALRPELGLDAVLGEGGEPLSGGERQRLALARALYRAPRVLLLDEPTSQVDPATTSAILQALRRAAEDGLTVVVVAHDPRVAAAADACVSLREGRLEETAWTAS